MSLDQVERGMKIKDEEGVTQAFQFARMYTKGTGKYGDDYLEKRDFRIFLIALKQRFEFHIAFKEIDEE